MVRYAGMQFFPFEDRRRDEIDSGNSFVAAPRERRSIVEAPEGRRRKANPDRVKFLGQGWFRSAWRVDSMSMEDEYLVLKTLR